MKGEILGVIAEDNCLPGYILFVISSIAIQPKSSVSSPEDSDPLFLNILKILEIKLILRCLSYFLKFEPYLKSFRIDFR
ncbi:hypothetical protein LEP1GSC108_2838 [Leptospira weilii str. UI 13098]|uniref:Uncharacterized protein n=1 Tax=Leptospira weilii str. UI 13098 TaxID=1088542 RepID=M6QDA4_9LEPT|nr:hypothetical protein LEP1GSC108_2838 [Leptospira weilii str. UI 13098]